MRGLTVFLALRNLRRQLRRSLSALLTIAIGVTALLLAEGYSAGMFSAFRESTIRAQYGHLQLTAPGFHERGRSNLHAHLMPAPSASLQAALPDDAVVAPRYLFVGLASAGDTTLPFSGLGLDPAVDAQGGSALRLVSGERLAADAADGVLVGQGLARRLGIQAGETIVLLVTTADEQLNARETTVTGVVASSSASIDDALLIAPTGVARELMRSEGSHQYLIYLSDGDELEAVQARLAAAARAEGFELRDWWSLAEFYRRAEQLFRQQLTVVVAIVTAILLLSISNTMMMTVLERTREIGTVMALGARPSRVLRGFVLEGAMLGLLGVLLGTTLAWVLSLGLDALALQMPPPPGFSVGYTASIELRPPLLLRVAFLSWGATVLACLWPAWRASRLEIVDALRVVR